MRPSPLDPARDERGFILVGVVTFMLALTILGLSLFALSSYEAQFFYASASREQSLQNSESGMELVKALLVASPYRLETAGLAVGQQGVTRALAYQERSGSPADTTSAGPIDWTRPVLIVVSARSGGVERTLQASFTPQTTNNPYQFLVASGGGLTYNQGNSTDPSLMVMAGRVWQQVQSAADTAWTHQVAWISGKPVRRGAPPLPLADDFVEAHLSAPEPGATPGTGSFELDNKGRYRITFVNDDAVSAAFFRMQTSATDDDAADDPEYREYSFYVNDYPLTLRVRGTVVWVIDRGGCFKNVVNVVQDDPDVPSALVIVARANGRDPGNENRALWLQGGLQVTSGNMRVFLVSQHDIAVMHLSPKAVTSGHEARSLSIVAGGAVELEGPAPSNQFDLRYSASTMDALADVLLAQRALPSLAGGSGMSFAPLPHTWLETTPR